MSDRERFKYHVEIELRRFRRWCWTFAVVLVVLGVPLTIFDLCTGGLGHVG